MKNSTSQPLITTVIPTYRRPKLLRKAILSVLNQTYPHFVVQVYDNASEDETAEMVGELARTDSRVKYHCHRKNIGAVQNFNYGMERVTTPFFSLLSDDNTLLPNFFLDAITALHRHREAILFAGQTMMIDEKGQTSPGSLDRWKPGLVHPPIGFLNILERGIPHWEGVLFRSVVIQSTGLLNPSFHGAVDQDFMMRIAREHTFYISKSPNALFLCHTNSWSNSRDPSEVISTIKDRLEPFLQDKDLPPSIRARIRQARTAKIKATISHFLWYRCLFMQDSAAIETARALMQQERISSFKFRLIVMLANLARPSRVLKKCLSSCTLWYIEFRRQALNIKDREDVKKMAKVRFAAYLNGST